MTISTQEMKITASPIGRGILLVSRSLTQELFPELLKLDDYTLQGELKKQGIFEMVHRVLMLPDSYSIIGIFYSEWMSYYRGAWSIVIESPDIPLADEGKMLPIISPLYQRHSDGSNSLLRIDIEK